MDSRLHRKLVEESSDTVSIVDEDGLIKYVSPSVEKLLGFEPEELVGEQGYDYEHPQDQSTLADAIQRVATGDSDEETVEARARRADGSWCWVEAKIQDRLDDPDIDGILVNSRDISERKRQNEQFQQLAQEYRTLLRTVDDGIFFVDVETVKEGTVDEGAVDVETVDAKTVEREYKFTFERVSRAYEDQTGLTTSEMRGNTPREVFGPTVGGELHEKYSRCADAGEPISYQEEVPVETGARFWQTSLAPVVTDGTVRTIIGITRDITARVGREQRLENQKQQLDEFAGVVSHDLRNPLSVAKGRVELLGDEIDSEHVPPIQRSLDRMEELISDTLVLARQGEVIAEQTAVPLSELLEGCWNEVETQEATLSVDDSLTVEGDENRLKHVFENLLQNAIEHGGSAVAISVGQVGDDGIYFEDTGPGFESDVGEEAFEPGYSSADDGTGFGLTIVKQITEAHGWSVEVSEGRDGGARFEFTGVEILSGATDTTVR